MENNLIMQSKKEWKTPELIVLIRSAPEETVLSNCKQPGNSPHTSLYMGCFWKGVNGGCLTCSDGGSW